MPRLYHPPEHPFGSACLKLKRANIHIKALRRSMRAALGPEVTVREEGELKVPRKFLGTVVERVAIHRVNIDPVLPRGDDWGLIVGDVVGNLRQSLDHIAWALAMTHAERSGNPLSDEEARRVAFPIYDREERFPDGGLRAIASIMPEACAAIEAFQPYHRADWPELELLSFLGMLSNRDKHRVVTIIFREVGVSFLPGDSGFRMRLNRPGDMKIIITESVAARIGDNLEPDVTADIVLDVGRPLLQSFPVHDLPRIRDFIRDTVMPALLGFVE